MKYKTDTRFVWLNEPEEPKDLPKSEKKKKKKSNTHKGEFFATWLTMFLGVLGVLLFLLAGLGVFVLFGAAVISLFTQAFLRGILLLIASLIVGTGLVTLIIMWEEED